MNNKINKPTETTMKKVLTIAALLSNSPMTMAEPGDTKRASEAVEKILKMKLTEKLNPYKNTAIKRLSIRLKNRLGSTPSATVKSIGALVKVVEKVIEPTLEIKTEDSKLKIKLLKFKNLNLNYKNKNNDLNFNFETNGKKSTLGLKMSF